MLMLMFMNKNKLKMKRKEKNVQHYLNNKFCHLLLHYIIPHPR